MRYGFIYQGTRTEEQEAALLWLESTEHQVWTVELEGLTSPGRGPLDDDGASGSGGRGPGHPNLSSLDALWWHRDHAINQFSPIHDDRVKEALTSYVADGGGLLLTQKAVEAAVVLDVESLPPDTTETNVEGATFGFSKRDFYTEHPVFEGFDEREFTTKTAARDHHDAPLYREMNTPQDGEVLAYLASDGGRVEQSKPVVSWYQGDGAVIGAATCVRFTDATDPAHQENLTTLIENALTFLPDGADRRLPGEERPRGRAEFLELRKRLADNPYRPRYHLAPPANWNNDPNGVVEYEGTYHMFYQYNPFGDFWGNMHWGHAVSDDMIHWEDRPIAMAPRPDNHGSFGIFSGAGVNVGDEVLFFYTSVGPEVHVNGSDMKQLPSRASASNADLTDVEKYDGNPLMNTPPMGAFSPPYDGSDADVPLGDPAGFRDHHVWEEDGEWYHMIGSTVTPDGGAAIVFRADDPKTDDWEYHATLTGDRAGFWECPQLFNFETTSLLHWSEGFIGDETVGYNLGQWDAEAGEFTIEEQGYVAEGEYYAPQAMTTQDGRVVMFGWVTPLLEFDDGWADTMMSLPHRLSEADDGSLRIRPTEEVANARDDDYDPITRSDVTLERGGESSPDDRPLEDLRYDSVEIDATIEPVDATAVTVNVLEHPDGEEVTPITYDFDAETLTVDHSASEADDDRQTVSHREDERTVAVEPNDDGLVDLHVYVDRSVVEVFVNESAYVVSRVYPTLDGSVGHSIEADGDVRLRSLDAYRMGAIWDHLDEESGGVPASLDASPRSDVAVGRSTAGTGDGRMPPEQEGGAGSTSEPKRL